PAIPVPTPASSRRPSRGRWACDWVAPRPTSTTCRSGPPSATERRRRWPICVARCSFPEWFRRRRWCSASPSIAVDELVFDGGRRRLIGGLGLALLGAAGADLGVHEVAQQDRCDNAERDPLNAIGQERPGIQVGERDDA